MAIKVLIFLSLLSYVALADFTLGANSEQTRTAVHSRNRDLKAELEEETLYHNGTIALSNVGRNTTIRDVYDPEWNWNSITVITTWESGTGGDGDFTDDDLVVFNTWGYIWTLPANVSISYEIEVILVKETYLQGFQATLQENFSETKTDVYDGLCS
ncbi:hypothetical protein C0J52_17673 [Blattella germanica]|nr:hypothetical protein C0J52_17673 [Blattella germanica]